MKVLIACEESQRVCIAFRERGHEAYSCDILDCSGGHPEWHIKGDVLPLINGRCEFETMDGNKHTVYCLPKYTQIIQPWMFGHPVQKKTCLWLKGLPNLVPTDICEERQSSKIAGNWFNRGGKDRQKNRAKTLHISQG